MRNVLLFSSLLFATTTAVLFACDGSVQATDSGDGGDASPSSSGFGSAGTGLATGLPCDVQAIIENRCLACHAGTDPPPLRNYDDFLSPSTRDPSKSRAGVSLERMKAKEMPPPPAVPPEDDEIAAFEAWVAGGAQRAPAACTDPPPDGAPGDAGLPVSVDGAAPGTCTSGKSWTRGDEKSELMHPGAACNACHSVQGGPNLRVAGTVYPTLHEPNDCNGSAPPPRLTVIVTDSRNETFSIPVNEAGNFLIENGRRPRPPFRARVTDGTKIRMMNGSVTSGDCNTCHTSAGLNGAPGRIVAP